MTLYAIFALLALLAWAVISGAPAAILVPGAAIVFGVILLPLVLRWLWRCRGTLRLWRSQRSIFRGRVPRADP